MSVVTTPAADVVYDESITALQSWTPTTTSVGLRAELRDHLRGALARELPGIVSVTTQSDQLCDLVVNETVGIIFYKKFSVEAGRNLRQALASGTLSYDRMIVYGVDLPATDWDRWRVIERRVTKAMSSTQRVEFLEYSPYMTDKAESHADVGVGQYFEPIMAFTVLFLGVGVVLLLDIQLGARSIVLTATTVTVTIVMLLATTGLLRESRRV